MSLENLNSDHYNFLHHGSTWGFMRLRPTSYQETMPQQGTLPVIHVIAVSPGRGYSHQVFLVNGCDGEDLSLPVPFHPRWLRESTGAVSKLETPCGLFTASKHLESALGTSCTSAKIIAACIPENTDILGLLSPSSQEHLSELEIFAGETPIYTV